MNTKANRAARIRKAVAGAEKHFADAPVAFDGATFTVEQLGEKFSSYADAIDATATAHAKWKDALAHEGATATVVLPTYKAFASFVVAHFGRSATEILADFCIKPPKARKEPSVDTKAGAAEKRRKTRELLGTKGKRQKLVVRAEASHVDAPHSTNGTTPTATPNGSHPA